MFQEIYQTYWHHEFNYGIKYIPREQFDAVLFIRTVSPPLIL